MKKSILLLLLIGAFASTDSTLLGAKECTYGPTYWCGSLSNAKQCSAVGHCIQTVWEKSSLPEDNDGVCDLCKEMVSEARKELLSDDVKKSVQKVVRYYCHMIPVKDIQAECFTLADDYIEELIQTLASQMNPHIVCASFGLCNSVKIDKLLEKNKLNSFDTFLQSVNPQQLSDRPDCDICREFFDEALIIIKSVPKEMVLNTMLSLCNRLGSFSDSCKANVEKDFEIIYTYLTTVATPDSTCKLIGVCQADENVQSVGLPRSGDEPCDYCMAACQFWRQILIANTTKEEFKEMLMQFCDQTNNFRGECRALVNQYYEVFYRFLDLEFQPKDICEAIGLCGTHSIFNAELPMWTVFDLNPSEKFLQDDIQPSNHIIGTDEAASYRSPHLSKVKLSKTDIGVSSHGQTGFLKNKSIKDDLCILCEFVLHFLQNVLQDKPTRVEIIEELDHVCTYMPKSIAEECQDYVDAYGDQILSLIIQELDPSMICPDIHLCPGVSNSLRSDSTCVLCEFAVTQIDEMLKDNKTEESIKEALESVCSVMPESIRSECVVFVDQYYNELIALLISELSPDEVCHQLGLCNNKKILSLPPPKEVQLPVSRLFVPNLNKELGSGLKLQQSAVCILCEMIIKEVDHLILDNSTVEEVEDAVAKVCSYLPSTLQDDCLGFIEEYAKPLLEMLVSQDLDPESICSSLRLCKSTFFDAMPKALVKKPKLNPEYCSICDDLLSFVKIYSRLNGVDMTEVQVIGVICPLVYQDYQKCVDFVIKDGSVILKLLQEYSPEKVCQMKGYCTKELMMTPGFSKCTWGPAYWCKSQLHAARCKATSHCEKNDWGTTKDVEH